MPTSGSPRRWPQPRSDASETRSLVDSVAFRHQDAGMARLIRHAAPHLQWHPDASGRHLQNPGCLHPPTATFSHSSAATWSRRPANGKRGSEPRSLRRPEQPGPLHWLRFRTAPNPVVSRTCWPTTTDRRPLMAVGSARPCHSYHPDSRDRHGTRSQCPPQLRREPAFARGCGRQDYHARGLLLAPTNPRREDMRLPDGTRERTASYPCFFRPGHAPAGSCICIGFQKRQ